MKLRVIITGGTGLLAPNIAAYKRDEWDLLLLTHTQTLSMEKVATAKANLIDVSTTKNTIESFKPDLVIHAAGMTNVEACEVNEYDAFLSNTVAAKNIAKICQDIACKLVHISTDHFANEKREYSTEDDISLPVNIYAQTKLQAECEVLRYKPDALIIRTNFFGWGHRIRKSFSDFIIDNLRAQKKITLYSDVLYTPILIDELADAISALVDKNECGVFNICSANKLSKFNFGLQVAEIFGLDPNLITKGHLPKNSKVVRPHNMALSNKKLVRAIGSSVQYEVPFSLTRLKQLEDEGRKKILLAASASLTSKKKILFYSKQNLNSNDVESVLQTLISSHLTQGPRVQEFESKLSTYTGTPYTVTFSNLTSALHAAYIAMGIGPGDYILTTPITFVATANAALFCGAKPILVDIDPNSLNIDPHKIEQAIQSHPEKHKIKAIVPVHFAGSPCDMAEIVAIAKKYNLKVFEDAAHAIGGKYLSGKKIGPHEGSIGAGFSFHPVKNLTTGEGAAICTYDFEFYQSLCRLRSHGITKGNDAFQITELAYTGEKLNPWYYEMQSLGFNYRLTDIQCALGISQLAKLDEFTKAKVNLAQLYDKMLAEVPEVSLRQNSTRSLSGNHLYVAHIDFKKIGITRYDFYKRMLQDGVSLHVHYIPIFYQPYYAKLIDVDPSQFTHSLQYYEGAVTLPLQSSMTDADVLNVVNAIKKNLTAH